MTLIEHYTQIFHRKYVYQTDENKNEEFFVKMNKHFAELKEIEKARRKKEKEIEEYLETINFNFGDVDYQEEIDYEKSLEEIKIDGKKLKFGKKYGMPTKYNYFYTDCPVPDEGLVVDNFDEKMDKKDWYVTFFQIDEGWTELEVDEEFDQSKLVWNGECMKYGDEYLSDEGGTKPNSDVETECSFSYEDDDVYCSFSHSWY